MSVQEVAFYSSGSRLAGTLKLPDGADLPDGAGLRVPAIVQGPGWLGLRGARLYHPYHDALLAAGFAVLVFDYRGFGDSEGSAQYLDPMDQVADIRAAVTYLRTRTDIDAERIGVFGSGGTGGGNAVYAAALDGRVKAAVAQVPVSDGRDWLQRMRREHEWLEFQAAVEADVQRKVLTGVGELVEPREGIMVPTPERRATSIKSDVDDRVPQLVELASASAIMAYRPIEVVGRIAPRALMIICVEHDATTPEDHAYALYERAGEPKRLVVQTRTSHYAAYERYRDVVNPMIVDWFAEHLVDGDVRVIEQVDQRSVRYLSDPADTQGGR